MHLKPKHGLSCDSKKCELEDCSKPRLAICEPVRITSCITIDKVQRSIHHFNMIFKFSDYIKQKTVNVSINVSKKTTSVTALHSKMTTERTRILTSYHKSRNTSPGWTHIISNNKTLQQTTRTNAKVSKRTTGNFSTSGLFTTETVISSNGMYSFANIHDETVVYLSDQIDYIDKIDLSKKEFQPSTLPSILQQIGVIQRLVMPVLALLL